MAHIFISHSRSDRKFAERIERELRRANQQAFLDVKSIRAGEPWSDRIDEAIRQARAVVVLLSPRSAKSEYVTYEWSFALGAGVRIVPVLVKKATLHPRLAGLQYIDFTGPWKEWTQLIKEIGPSTNRRAAVSHKKEPTIFAKFELGADGQPTIVNGSYKIWLETRNVPAATEKVTYEILDPDKTFDQKKFTVRWGQGEFEDWITSYGDIFLTARGKTGKSSWRTKTTLSSALRRGLGKKLTSHVQKALKEIEEN